MATDTDTNTSTPNVPSTSDTKQKPIIILNGTGGSGKNTFADMFSASYHVAHISMVDIVKIMVGKMGLVSHVKDETYRKFLSDIKLALEAYLDLPFKSVTQAVDVLLRDDSTDIIFIDMREPYDIERISKLYDITTVLVYNPRVADITSNIADASVYDMAYDYVVENSGDLDLLWESANTLMSALKGEKQFDG